MKTMHELESPIRDAGAALWLVGGAVRDRLLGRDCKDRDFVVVGGAAALLEGLGLRQVGVDFPVYIDGAGCEFALARRERKSGAGHRGFAVEFDPGVTLREDLARRDLTINAIALQDRGRHQLFFDPFFGQNDIRDRIIRHVRDDSFPEDPLRVLRVARFAAQLGFDIAPETDLLMRRMVEDGMLAELTPERVFQEISRALRTAQPSRFFRALERCDDALHIVLPELQAIRGVDEAPEWHPEGDSFEHVMLVLDAAAKIAPGDDTLGWCALGHDLGKALTPPEALPRHPGHEEHSETLVRSALERLRAPTALRDAAGACAREHMRAKKWLDMRPGRVLRMLERLDAFRHPERLPLFLNLCEADERGRGRATREENLAGMRAFLPAALEAAKAVRGADVLANWPERKPGPWVAEILVQWRVRAIAGIGKRGARG